MCGYIYTHIKERITITTLAEYTDLSESYLSRVFKQNLGISISDYIREKKIEKATHLLRYSDKPIVDIANYLSFSSQSHFIQIFENYTGLTPKKYRDKYYKSMWICMFSKKSSIQNLYAASLTLSVIFTCYS